MKSTFEKMGGTYTLEQMVFTIRTLSVQMKNRIIENMECCGEPI